MCKCANVQMCKFIRPIDLRNSLPAESPPYAVTLSFSFAGLSGQGLAAIGLVSSTSFNLDITSHSAYSVLVYDACQRCQKKNSQS